jgi:membrane-bound metal-dependent hydrolase YbcI (DUF457 family)
MTGLIFQVAGEHVLVDSCTVEELFQYLRHLETVWSFPLRAYLGGYISYLDSLFILFCLDQFNQQLSDHNDMSKSLQVQR